MTQGSDRLLDPICSAGDKGQQMALMPHEEAGMFGHSASRLSQLLDLRKPLLAKEMIVQASAHGQRR
jgi:hypothetical protein